MGVTKYDEQERMSFGKYLFYRFEEVPNDYWRWLRSTCNPFEIQRKYPNLWKYMKEVCDG